MELGAHLHEDVKAEFDEDVQLECPIQSEDTQLEDQPDKIIRDDTAIRHEVDTYSCATETAREEATFDPIDSSLDSVYQYTSKIRAFVGLNETAKAGFLTDQQLESHNASIKDNTETEHAEIGELTDGMSCDGVCLIGKGPFSDDAHQTEDTVVPASISKDGSETNFAYNDSKIKPAVPLRNTDCVLGDCIQQSEVGFNDIPREGETVDVSLSRYEQSEIESLSDSECIVNGKLPESLNLRDSSLQNYDDTIRNIQLPTLTSEVERPSSPIKDDIVIGSSLSENFEAESEGTEQRTEITNDPLSHEKAEHTPYMDGIRRMSAEIVTTVLNTARSQLKDMLNTQKNIQTNQNHAENLMNPELPKTEEAKNNLPEANYNLGYNLQGNAISMLGNNNAAFDADSEQCNEKTSVKEIQLKGMLSKTYDTLEFQKKIEVEMNKFDPMYDVDPDTVCGIGSFKPEWIQKWATARVYLVLYCIIGVLSGSYYSYLIGSLSTLEKRFAFKSKVSGSIMMMDEITPLLLGILIGYFGGKSHRPRMVGFGMLLSSICCLVTSMPYFIYGPGTHLTTISIKNETSVELCNGDIREDNCDSDDRPPTMAAILFLMLGSFLKGFGNLAYYAIGLAYMDDNAKKRNTPMYFAVAFALRLLGPMLGFLMSSFFLKYYENPFVDPGFGPDDPRWIGGWWMGFCLQGVLLLIFTIPISLFPRRLPGHKKPNLSSGDEIHQSVKSLFAGLFLAIRRLVKNPFFLLIVLNTIFAIFGSFGHYIMLPKYMENQFRLSASDASLLSGPPAIGALIIATLVGGYLTWRFKPSARFLIAGMVTLDAISALAYLLLMIPRCQSMEMSNFGSNNDGLILDGECNSNCSCSTSEFHPVCGPDGSTLYFSPCSAGCQEGLNQTYFDCSCVSHPLGLQNNSVTKGFCFNEHCWSQALIYIIALPVMQLCSLFRVAHTMLLLRSVHPADKSIALGAFETLICTFGFIPYPVLFGALVDSACLVWEKSCGKTGNCWFYDVSKFNYLLHGASALFNALSSLVLVAMYFLSARVYDLYEEDEEDDNFADVQPEKGELEASTKSVNNTTKM